MQELDDRADYIETKLCEFMPSFNTLVNAHNMKDDDTAWFKVKVADWEDKSCQNSSKILGIAELIQPVQLKKYVQDIFATFLPSLPSLMIRF